jgi:hypothetical protein
MEAKHGPETRAPWSSDHPEADSDGVQLLARRPSRRRGHRVWKFCFDLLEIREPDDPAQLDFLQSAYAHIMGAPPGHIVVGRRQPLAVAHAARPDRRAPAELVPLRCGRGHPAVRRRPRSPTDLTWCPAPPPATGSSSSSTAGTANPAAHSATPSPTAMTELGAAARRGHTVTGSNPVPATSLTSKNERGAQTLISCARGRTRYAFAPALPQYHAPVGD